MKNLKEPGTQIAEMMQCGSNYWRYGTWIQSGSNGVSQKRPKRLCHHLTVSCQLPLLRVAPALAPSGGAAIDE